VVWIKLMNWIELIKRNISQKLRFFNTTCILRPCQKRPVSEICHRPIVSFRRTINAGRPKYFPVVKSPRFSTDVWRRRSSHAQTLDRKIMQNLKKTTGDRRMKPRPAPTCRCRYLAKLMACFQSHCSTLWLRLFWIFYDDKFNRPVHVVLTNAVTNKVTTTNSANNKPLRL